MIVYIIEVKYGLESKISQEGYDSYEKAKEFIIKRGDKPNEITPYLFISDSGHQYFIHDVKII